MTHPQMRRPWRDHPDRPSPLATALWGLGGTAAMIVGAWHLAGWAGGAIAFGFDLFVCAVAHDAIDTILGADDD